MTTPPLSPAAQAVLTAMDSAWDYHMATAKLHDYPKLIAAAALRAVADHAGENRIITGRWISDAALHAIANELDPNHEQP